MGSISKKAQRSILSRSFCDPQGEQENGEVFRRVDTYVCASIHFSSTLRKNSDFFSIYSNVKTFRQRNCHEGRLVIKWNVQFQKISIPPTPWNFHSRGACHNLPTPQNSHHFIRELTTIVTQTIVQAVKNAVNRTQTKDR